MRRLTFILAATMLGACGGDNPTGPFVPPELAGQWQWTVTNATGSGRTCTVTGVTVTFTGTNSALTGSFAAAGGQNVSCVVGGQTTLSNFSGGAALSGVTLTGAAIGFTFGSTSGPWVSTGTVTGPDGMGGSATIRLSSGGVPFPLTGTWTATRN
jgi:hypothetical protein